MPTSTAMGLYVMEVVASWLLVCLHSGTEDVCAGGTPVAYALRFDAATDRFAEVTEVLNFGDTSHSGLSVVAADVDGTPWVGVLVFVLWVNCLCLRIGWVPRR